ncbi:MAG: hypothetical protein JST09_15065 [Bacteroidetes bacterium]|nr:hypothetical protein [Bacteroidota bacterium]
MPRLTFLSILLFITVTTFAQQTILLYKKKNKTIQQYWPGATISFQLKDKEWRKGELVKVKSDSIYVRPFIVNYSLWGRDTSRFNEEGYSFSDLYAMPKRGVLIHYTNGHYEIQRDAGHQHFYWIKSGFIFRLGAAMYTAAHIINGLIRHNLSLQESAKPLGIAAAVYAGGEILHESYKVTRRIKGKYHFEILKL